MLRRTHKLAILDWGLALLVGALLVAPALALEQPQEPGTAKAAILDALNETTTLEFIDEPLSNVVDYWKEQHKIEIQIDTRALDDVNMGTDTPVTKSLNGISLQQALRLILDDLDLTYVIRDDVLMITTPEEAEMCLICEIYDVGELVMVHDSGGKPWSDFDTLVDALTTTIQPESWSDVGGPGSIAALEFRGAKVLIVRQTFDVHQQVAKLLKDLAKIADRYGDDVYPTRDQRPPQPPMPGMGAFGGMMGGMGGGFAPPPPGSLPPAKSAEPEKPE